MDDAQRDSTMTRLGNIKVDDGSTLNRSLHLRFTLPATADPAQVVAFIAAAKPYFGLFGGREVRLLQNVDRPWEFIQVLDYDVHESLETSRQKIACDPRLQAFLQGWRQLFPGTIEVDVFREVAA